MNQSHTETLAAMTIEMLLKRWPAAAEVFQRRKMACPGCAVAAFYTIVDAAEIYGLSPDLLLAEIAAAIAAADH